MEMEEEYFEISDSLLAKLQKVLRKHNENKLADKLNNLDFTTETDKRVNK